MIMASIAFAPTRKSRNLFVLLNEGSAAATRYLLLLRFVVINLVCFGLLGAAWLQGWVHAVIEGDQTRLVLVIAATGAYGLARCTREIWRTSVDLNSAKGWAVPVQLRNLSEGCLKLKLGTRIAPVRRTANNLVFLGLIGTVIGFVIALSGVNSDAAADISSIGSMIGALIAGMGVALYTTLVGSILYLWLSACCLQLEGGAVDLVLAVVAQRRE